MSEKRFEKVHSELGDKSEKATIDISAAKSMLKLTRENLVELRRDLYKEEQRDRPSPAKLSKLHDRIERYEKTIAQLEGEIRTATNRHKRLRRNEVVTDAWLEALDEDDKVD